MRIVTSLDKEASYLVHHLFHLREHRLWVVVVLTA